MKHRKQVQQIASHVLVAVVTTVIVLAITAAGAPQAPSQSKLDALQELITDRFIGESDKVLMEDPDKAKLIAISKKIGCNGYYVFTINPGEEDLAHGRMFSPAGGIPEDPVTGNANGPLGAYLVHFGLLGDNVGEHVSFQIVQGEAIGRAGRMQVDVDVENGEPVLVKLTGKAVVAFSAEIEL